MHEANVVATELARKSKEVFRDWRVRIVLITLGIVFVTGLIVYRYIPKSAHAECAFRIADEGAAPPSVGETVRVKDCVTLEVVANDSARTLGLSGRQSMPRERGMLFDFRGPGQYCMWMKDMNFSLDMLWLNEQKEIVNILEGVAPETYPQSFCGPADARYVIEVNAGIVQAGGLRTGQSIRF